ncbi:hypothetical protein MUB42_07045 (plasmid) [Apilactobacillus kunkeei]|nr:hypothetical protein MUB42_07045 [Apilactobacillus kunkeei]
MLKKTIYIIGLASLASIMLVGCGKSKTAHQSDKPYGAGQVSKKVNSGSTSNSSSSETNSSESGLNLDNKTYGILALAYKYDIEGKEYGDKPDSDPFRDYNSVKKPDLDSDSTSDSTSNAMFYMDKDSKYGAKHNLQLNELTANSAITEDLMFDVQKDSVYLQFKDMAKAINDGTIVAPVVRKTVSKDYLVNTYYKTAEQRKHVDNYAKSTLSEEVYDKHNQVSDDDD